MIQVTLQFDSMSEAHAAMGMILAVESTAFVAAVESVVESERNPKPKAKRKAKKAEPVPTPPPTSQESAADSDPLQVLRLALAEYSKTHGFKAATDLLKEFQIKRLPELPEAKYDAFTEALCMIPESSD